MNDTFYTCRACGNQSISRRCSCRGSKQKENAVRRDPERSHHTNDLKWKTARFIALDGEGIGETDEYRRIVEGGIHTYTLFVAWTPDGPDYIEDYEHGLTTFQCFDFLLRIQEKYPKDIFVIYAGNYDFNMMLGKASKENIAELWAKRSEDSNYTRIEGTDYETSFLPKKYYRVRRVIDNPKFVRTGRTKPDGKPEWKRNVGPHILIWDVVGFFQSTFVAALEGYKIGTPDLIRDMKQRRKQFSSDDKDIIREYCFSECEHLVLLMGKLRDALIAANIHPSRWDGAGAVAAALMKREHVKEHMQPTSPQMMHAVRSAYSGGRIELLRYGVIDRTIYQYDINSAYPSAMVELPSLAGRDWVRSERVPFSISHIRWEFPKDQRLYPFSYRGWDGRIFYPYKGETWVWEPELAAGLKYYPDCVEVIETYAPEGTTTDYPFHFLPELFHQRKEYKKQGNMAEKALKLGINSLYGKTAQQTGGKVKDGKVIAPPFFQLEWAGYTTSRTRAKLFDAAMQSPDSIVALATDGIFSLVPLDLPMGDGLGEWEYKEWASGVFAQSGVYFLKDASRKEGDQWTHHYRGFDAGTLTVESVSKALNKGLDNIVAKQTRFVTMGLALHTDWSTWRRWITKDRVLKLRPDGTKRRLVGSNRGIRRTLPEDCVPASQGEPSNPFKILWLDGIESMPDQWKQRQEVIDYENGDE